MAYGDTVTHRGIVGDVCYMIRLTIYALAFTVKLLWGAAVVLVLAAQEPWWHQALIVLGGAVITAVATIGGSIAGAIITTRRIQPPVEGMRVELEEHRQAIEGNHGDGV